MRHKFLLTILFSMIAAGAFPQTTDRPPGPRLRIGPLELFPTIALTNLGVDTNVFNEPDQLAPKSDFMLTLTPAADLQMRLGKSQLTGTFKEDLVYYQTYASERSVNSLFKARIDVPLNRVILSGGAGYLNTRERPGFEIDARSQRREAGFNAAVEVRALPKVFVGLKGDRTRIAYDKDAIFLGSNLNSELTRTLTNGALTGRYRLTPLTDLTFDLGLEQYRFEFSPLRDSNSTRVAGGVTFEKRAFIKGSASFGYRDFRPTSSDLEPYRGLIAAVDLFTAIGPTKLGLQFDRDVQYSYDVNQPYYLQTGGTGSITQHLAGPVDATGRFGAARLNYRNRITPGPLLEARTDHAHSYGGGVGFRMSRHMRIGVNVDKYSRTSTRELRQYNGLIFGTSVTYGY